MSDSDTDFVKNKNMQLDRILERALMGVMGVLLYFMTTNQWEMSKSIAVHTKMLDDHAARIMISETITSDLKAMNVHLGQLKEMQLELKRNLEEHMRSKK